jgi:diguanylate cyclase (GGDEF)-like protein
MHNIAMQEGIRNLFYQCDEDDERIYSAIEALAETQGERVYHEALNYLFAKDFSLAQASRYWREATASISKTGDHKQSFRAALLDYLRQKTTELTNPRIIESHDLEEIQLSAVTDGLTRLYNQSYFKQQLQQAIELANSEAGQTFSIIIFDLDHFKQFNDRCGHLQGDLALRQIGDILRTSTGELDLPARYGGEEFSILLPDCNLEAAIPLAERIRGAIDSKIFTGQERLDNNNLTISGGIACYPQHGQTADELIEAADRRLYEAKTTRNAILPRLDDARGANRHQFRNIVEIRLEGRQTFTSALSSDISHTGLSLKSDSAPQIGTKVFLQFRYPFWPKNLETTGTVRHVGGNTSAGAFKLGIQFDTPQNDFFKILLPGSIPQP